MVWLITYARAESESESYDTLPAGPDEQCLVPYLRYLGPIIVPETQIQVLGGYKESPQTRTVLC